MLIPVAILGGIYTGVFTPTEAGAVAILLSVIIGLFFYRELNLTEMWRAIKDGTKSSANIYFMIGAASLLGMLLTAAQVPQMFTTAVLSLGLAGLLSV